MSSTDNSQIDAKLDYLQDTKTLIKRTLINKGVNVTDSTTFREYAGIIDNLNIAQDQSDSTATPDDIVKNKIAYSNNNKIVGTLIERSSISANALNVEDDVENQQIKGNYNTDTRLLLNTNANVEITIPYNKISGYNNILQNLNNLLDIE